MTGVPACERRGCTSARQAAARACLRTESAALRICGPRPNKSFAKRRCHTSMRYGFAGVVERMWNICRTVVGCMNYVLCIIACLSRVPSYPVGFWHRQFLQPGQVQTQSSAVSLCTFLTRRLEALLL